MWKKIQKKFLRLPPLFRNVYFLSGTLFVTWMFFVDDNNVVNQYRRHSELSSLLEKRKFYQDQIKETDREFYELNTNPVTQEKFARERYYMKRDNEDVFVIVEEK